MKNYVQLGDDLDVVTPAGGMVSGTPYKIGSLFGIANNTTAQNATNVLSRRGVYSGLPKATGAAWALGDLLYWDDTAKNFTKTASTNIKAGVATAAALSGDATGTVLLIPSI